MRRRRLRERFTMPGSAARFLSCAAAAAGVSLTLAGSVLPAAAPTAASHRTASLRDLLNPNGGETHPETAELAAAQQAFGARHFGALALARPGLMSAALQRGVAQAALGPQSTTLSGRWKLLGPSSYFANDPLRSGSLTNLGMENLSGRVTTIATTPQRPGQVWVGAADGGVW